VVAIDEQRAEAGNKAPKAAEAQEALAKIIGAVSIRELPTDEKAHRFELSGAQDGDLRAEIFRLMVAKGWTLLELRRDAQSLDTVFRDLTRSDERLDRGRELDEEEEESEDTSVAEEEDDEEEETAAEKRDEDEDEDEDEDDDDDDDDDDKEIETRAERKG
jgi:ABC-2 type transport system ATP-binding protein